MRIPNQRLLIGIGLLATLVAAAPGAVATAAEIQVVFADDDMGFTVTSSQDISNVIVKLCDGTTHKHDDLQGTTFEHEETQVIVGVWVKSGDNAAGGDAPPGAGEWFANAGADCDEECTEDCTPPPCTQDCTPPPPCTQDCTPPPPPCEVDCAEVPFFPNGTSVVLGALGTAGLLAVAVLRRRSA